MARTAERLGRLAARGNPAARALPHLWLFTEPDRLPNPAAALADLPAGAGVVVRTFGRAEAETEAARLAELARHRGVTLLVGEDEALATSIGAAGLHVPQRRLSELQDLRRRHPDWRLTAAAHDLAALRLAECGGADGVFVSPVFDSASPSAGVQIGVEALRDLASRVRTPVYALGGVTAERAQALIGTGVAGVAAIDGLRT